MAWNPFKAAGDWLYDKGKVAGDWIYDRGKTAINSIENGIDTTLGLAFDPISTASRLIGDLNGSNATNATNKAIAEDTNATNKAIAEENLQYQRENLDYQKALQQQLFAREDTSYQRTLNDMRSSGMSPFMMQGTNGAGEAIATEPLNNSFQKQGYQVTPNDVIGSLASLASMASALNGLQIQGQQVRKMSLENDILDATKGFQIGGAGLNFNKATRDFNFQKLYGITDSQTGEMKNIFALGSALGMPFTDNSGNFKNVSSKDFEAYIKKVSEKMREFSPSDLTSIVSDPTSIVTDVGKQAIKALKDKTKKNVEAMKENLERSQRRSQGRANGGGAW